MNVKSSGAPGSALLLDVNLVPTFDSHSITSNNRTKRLAMRNPAKFLTAFLSILLGSALSLAAQSSPSAAPANSAPATRNAAKNEPYPEQAYLSPSRYTNQFFDFSFDLPPEAQLRAIPEPGARDGSIQLLELGSPPPTDAEIAISAIPTAGSGNNKDAKTFLRYALDQELYRGVEELRGLSKASIAGHQFFLFETRRGIDQHVVLATALGDYILRVVLASHDEKMVHKLEAAFDRVVFFAPPELNQVAGSDARPYDGPSISSHQLETLESDPPANHIDPGTIRGDFYENPTIGFSYRIPQGWVLEANGAVQPAVERDRERQDFGRPRVGRTEHRLMDACSRTLFSVWAKRPAADGQISYDDFGEVTVSAISLACFPRMRFPADSADQKAGKDFLLQFALTHPIVDDMRDAREFTAGGNVFLYLHGAIGFQIPNDALARRLSIAMAITERRGYLLTWFFAAPHDQELQALTNERVTFDSAPPAKIVGATQPGGSEAANPAAVSVAAASAPTSASAATKSAPVSANSVAKATPNAAAGASPATASNAGSSAGNAAAASTSDSSAAAQTPSAGAASDSASSADAGSASSNPAADSSSSTDQGPGDHPSLLRPGETVQQSKGAPIQRKNQSQ